MTPEFRAIESNIGSGRYVVCMTCVSDYRTAANNACGCRVANLRAGSYAEFAERIGERAPRMSATVAAAIADIGAALLANACAGLHADEIELLAEGSAEAFDVLDDWCARLGVPVALADAYKEAIADDFHIRTRG